MAAINIPWVQKLKLIIKNFPGGRITISTWEGLFSISMLWIINVVYCTVGGSKTLIDCHTSNNGIDMNGIYMNIELLLYSEKEMLKDKNWVQS